MITKEVFNQKKCEIALLLVELNFYAKSKVINDFAIDLKDIDIDDSVVSKMTSQQKQIDDTDYSDVLDEGVKLIDGVLVNQSMRNDNFQFNKQVFESCKTMVDNGEYEKAIETIQSLKYYCENLKTLHLAALEMWHKTLKLKAE